MITDHTILNRFINESKLADVVFTGTSVPSICETKFAVKSVMTPEFLDARIIKLIKKNCYCSDSVQTFITKRAGDIDIKDDMGVLDLVDVRTQIEEVANDAIKRALSAIDIAVEGEPNSADIKRFIIIQENFLELFYNNTKLRIHSEASHDSYPFNFAGFFDSEHFGNVPVFLDTTNSIVNVFIGTVVKNDSARGISASSLELYIDASVNDTNQPDVTNFATVLNTDLPCVAVNFANLNAVLLDAIDNDFPSTITFEPAPDPIPEPSTKELVDKIDHIMKEDYDTRTFQTNSDEMNYVKAIDEILKPTDFDDVKFTIALTRMMIVRLDGCETPEEMEDCASRLEKCIDDATQSAFDIL